MKPAFRISICFLLLVGAACSSTTSAPAGVAARVNGVDITIAELEDEFARRTAEAEPPLAEEDVPDLMLQLLGEMINNEILLQKAASAELTATDAEVDVQFNAFKSEYTAEAFLEVLAEQQMTEEDLREEMRMQLTIEKLVNKEITSKISVSEAQIEEFYNRNIESFNLPESFRLAHILITPFEDPQPTNSTGDDATTEQDAVAKAERLLREIQGGSDFATVARQFSEDPTSSSIGGDLNFQAIETIGGIGPELADAVLNMRVGETFPRVVVTQFGFHILKLLEQDAGGQKDLTDPRIQAQIRQNLFDRRDGTLKGAFFENARNSSQIRNFYAEQVLDSAGAGGS